MRISKTAVAVMVSIPVIIVSAYTLYRLEVAPIFSRPAPMVRQIPSSGTTVATTVADTEISVREVDEEVPAIDAPTSPSASTTPSERSGDSSIIETPSGLVSLVSASSSVAADPHKPPQFVVLAFDGSRSIQMWKDTRQFAKDMTAQGKPLKFTYFISAVYLLENRYKDLYHPPEHPVGSSAIGFADNSAKDISDRLEQMNLAFAEGNEIGSHLAGHFSGSTWTTADWNQEFDQFSQLISNVSTNNALLVTQPAARRSLQLSTSGIIGLRAPELGVSPALWQVLKDRGYRYDASRIGKPDIWPQKNAQGTWEMPLAKIRYATTTSAIASMDYNFYFKQSNAKDVAKKGTPEWDDLFRNTYNSYANYFNQNDMTTRAPVFMGNHFSLWNDGVYWQVMKTFASDVCGRPEVRCVTFSQLADYLDAHGTVSPPIEKTAK